MDATDLENEFNTLLSNYKTSTEKTLSLWNEIRDAYSEKHRHYHTLTHLAHNLNWLKNVKSFIRDWNAILLALFYHDAVYRINGKQNEEKSAELARTRMSEIGMDSEIISKVVELILATKKHEISNDADTNIFTDADLSILGQPWPDYQKYLSKVRNEYKSASDSEFRAGRRREMKRLLQMDAIFKTEYFNKSFETAEYSARTRQL
jgi:predicted metal-dependent HD superfamily phosphohydrolase